MWKNSFQRLVIVCASLINSGCASGPALKIWVSRPEDGGLVRRQDKAVLPYPETKGYFCVSPKDLNLLFILLTEQKKETK